MIEQLTFWQCISLPFLTILVFCVFREIICFFLGTEKIGDELEKIRKILEENNK